MLDSTLTNVATIPAWQDHVSPGDIVLLHFPIAKEGHSGRPKARPCLVLDIERREGLRYAVLAYGTSSRRSNVSHEVHVRRAPYCLAAGLNEPTRFVGARHLLVPLTHCGFLVFKATGTAVLGRLDGVQLKSMHAVRAQIDAERNIVAYRRARRSSRSGADHGMDTSEEQRLPRRCDTTGKAGQ